MSKGTRGRGGKRQQRTAHKPAAKQHGNSNGVRYGIRFTEQGRDTIAAIFDQYRDRPLYYLLDEQGEAAPVGQSHLLTAEERARWRACWGDPAARALAETIIPNPEHPAYPVIVHTAFMAMDTSFASSLPNGTPALWKTAFLDKPLEEMEADAKSEADEDGDDGSWLVEGSLPDPPEVVALAVKLELPDAEAFDSWERVYSTRAEALQGHEETVRWVRRSLGVF